MHQHQSLQHVEQETLAHWFNVSCLLGYFKGLAAYIILRYFLLAKCPATCMREELMFLIYILD